MAVDPVGLDFDVVGKTLDKPNRKATVVFDVYFNGVKRGQFTLILDAGDISKATTDFAYKLGYVPGA